MQSEQPCAEQGRTRHEAAVHNVHMHPVGTGLNHVCYLCSFTHSEHGNRCERDKRCCNRWCSHKYPPNNKCNTPLEPAKLQATAINKISTLPGYKSKSAHALA